MLSLRPTVILSTFFSLALTGILVAAPIEYVPAPGGLFVVVPEQTEEAPDEQTSWVLQDSLSEAGSASASGGGGSGGINSQNGLSPDSNFIGFGEAGNAALPGNALNQSGRSSNTNPLARALLEGQSANANQAAAQRVAMARAAPTIDNYANASYDGRNDPVGHVAADFAVSANGAATYNVPIAIPPGIGDVQPSISLTYNSQSGDGIAGRGMELVGLSRITRCGSTLAQDGEIRPVQLDSGDYFCLDGQRLIETHRSGATIYYQTEIKGYDEITAYFYSFYNQPLRFTVKTVAGETLEYGYDATARINPTKPGTSSYYTNETDVRYPYAAWLLSKTSDIKGNYIKYRYTRSLTSSGSESLLQRIEYTGTRYAQPYAAIHFDYENRTGNKATSYLGGGALYQSKRLKKIRVTQGSAGSYNTTAVRTYNLKYYSVNSNSAHNYDRLRNIEECPYSETGVAFSCLPPTYFRWNGGYASESAELFGSSSGITTRSLLRQRRGYTPTDTDLQGDNPGLDGFYGQGHVLNEYGHLGSPAHPGRWDYGTYKDNDDPKYPGKDYTLMGDVNGDGLADIIGLKGTEVQDGANSLFRYNYQVVASVSDGKTFQTNAFHTSTSALLTNVWLQKSDLDSGNLATLADVNADGLSDLVLIGYYYVYVALSNGNSFNAPVKWRSQDLSSADVDFFTAKGGWARGGEDGTEQRYIMDINGDGRADLVGLDDTGGLYAALSTIGQSKVFGSVGRISSAFTAKNSANHQFGINEDKDFPYWTESNANKISRFSFADVNGDGLPDAIRLSKNGIEVAVNRGKYGLPASIFETTTRWDASNSIWGDASDYVYDYGWILGTTEIASDTLNSNLAYWLSRFHPHTFADMNGDGLSDFVLFANNSVRVAFSTGKSFKAPVEVSDSFGRFSDQYTVTNSSQLADCSDVPSYNHYDSTTTQNRSMWVDERKDPRYLVDVNGDGRADILGYGSNGVYVALSQGNTFGPMSKWIDQNDTSFSYDACWQPGYNIRTVGDVTGDGMVDLVGIGFTGVHVGQNFVKPQRVEQIISGGYLPENGASNYDGLHRSIDIDYDSLSTSVNYQRTDVDQYRGLTMYVVTAHHDSDGEIGTVRPHRSTLNYHYQDLKIDPYRGMQGFRSREVVDNNAKTRTEEFYHQYFPLTGRPYVQRTYAKNAGNQEKMVKEVSTTLDPGSDTANSQGIYEILLQSTLETDFTLASGSRFKQLLTEFKDYDDCGQAREIDKSQGNWNGNNPQPHEATYGVTTVNEYPTSGNCRVRSRLDNTTVTHSVSGQPAKTKKSKFIYYPDGLLHQEIVEPDRSDEQKVTTTYSYNLLGQITNKAISGLGGRVDKNNTGLRSSAINRSTTTHYTPDYRFVSSTEDSLGFTTEFEYDKRFGLVKKTTDANGLISQARYNSLGQAYLKEGPQGGVTHTTYEWCDTDVRGARARYCVTTKNLNVATSQYAKQYFDSVDRLLRTESMGANTNGGAARQVYKDKIYDVETGRLLQESLPYYFNPPKWITYTYDALGRTLTVEQPDGSDTTLVHNGLTTSTTNDKGQTTIETRTPRGKVVKAVDAIGGSVNHVYDSLGNLKTTTVIAKEGANNTGANRSISTSFTYDLRGNKESMTDPDMGTWQYYYNALGEMTLQVDAKGQATVLTYDTLGRMVQRDSNDESTTWIYHPQSASDNDRGRLQKATSVMKNHVGTAHTYEKSFLYNDYGQPLTVTEKVPGSGGNNSNNGNTYQFSHSYDSWGRPETLTYPKVSSNQPTVGITYQYDNALGHLEAISDSNNSSLKHWELTGVEADGKTQREVLGGKVTSSYTYDTLRRPWFSTSSKTSGGSVQLMQYDFDSLGNLTLRQDHLNSAKETFEYDDLNRLTDTHTTYAGISTPLTTSNTYDGHGNLRSKDSFEYKYGTEPPYGSWFGSSFHQVNQLLVNGGFRELRQYDANGNMTDAGQGRKLQWNSFNKPSHIQRLGPTASFLYNADQQRMFQSATEGWTWYAGGGLLEHFERRSTNRETLKYALMVNGQKIGYIKQSFERSFTPSTGFQATNLTNDTYYLLNDHLGSPQALLDSNGNKLEDLSFTAWGERRAASYNPTAAMTPALDLLRNYALTEGFTGHEHDDAFGFINMKGRLYDPVLGRFLSADPFVQAPNNTQSYNRYSYVFNNPLSYTDPSGYISKKLHGVLRTVVAITSFFVAPHLTIGQFIAFSAATSAALSYAATGSLETAFTSGLISGVTAGLSRGLAEVVGASSIPEGFMKNLAHGVAQGTVSVLQGGKFKHGFISAFVSHATRNAGKYFGLGTPRDGNPTLKMGRTVLAAVIGGTVSDRTGGKFANGAMTAAFVHLYNAEATQPSNGSVSVGDSSFDYTTVGSKKYAEEINELLVDIASTDAGATLLTEIASNGGSVEFIYGAGEAMAVGNVFSRHTSITFNPAYGQRIATTAGSLVAQPRFILAHELHHAWTNTLSCWLGCSRPLVLPGSVPTGLKASEAHAVRYTNLIRTQAGVGYQRTHYGNYAIP